MTPRRIRRSIWAYQASTTTADLALFKLTRLWQPYHRKAATDFDGDNMRVTLQFTGLFCVRQIDTNRPRCGAGAVQVLPFPAEYDGDSKTDVAVYRDGTWFIIRSSDGA